MQVSSDTNQAPAILAQIDVDVKQGKDKLIKQV
jgi:hypothetical protein